jgi:hypothetical protein
MALRLEGDHAKPRDAKPPDDVARREAKHDSDEKAHAQREIERTSSECRPSDGEGLGGGGGHPPGCIP